MEKNHRRFTEDLQARPHPKIHVYIHINQKEFHQIVGFDAYGKDKLIALIKNNGDVSATLGLTDKEFEKRWELYVKDKNWLL